jgi:hypothetical protein
MPDAGFFRICTIDLRVSETTIWGLDSLYFMGLRLMKKVEISFSEQYF